MSDQAPEHATPRTENPEERRIQAFVTSFGEIRAMDLKTDTLRALLDDDPLETERTEERAPVGPSD